MQKRILFLGGSHFQLPPVLYAKNCGHYVILCDHLPDNPGREYADEYYPISTTDLESVLQLSKRLCINGIVAYASDPAAATAAYVAECLNLPGNPYESVRILSQKDLYRRFLKENGFNTPPALGCTSLKEAQVYLKSISLPVMVKPVDSSGSKGVSKICFHDELPGAFKKAMSFSRTRKVLLEQYIERKGYQIAGDGFVQDGTLVFRCFAQEHFKKEKNHFVPIGESFPLQLPDAIQIKVHNEINRLLSLLKMKVGALNFDIILTENNDVYLMEIGPRAGGNLISEVIKYSTEVDMVAEIVNCALDSNYNAVFLAKSPKSYSSYILHSAEHGLFKRIVIDPHIERFIAEELVFVKEGSPVISFQNSGGSLGCLILKFDSPGEMLKAMDSIHERVSVELF